MRGRSSDTYQTRRMPADRALIAIILDRMMELRKRRRNGHTHTDPKRGTVYMYEEDERRGAKADR